MSTWLRYNFPTAVLSGVDASKEIPSLLKEEACTSPLVVTDRGLASLPLVADFMQMLRDGGLQPTLFSEIGGNPVKSQVNAGVEVYLQSNSNSVIGLGGGAAIDVAKTIALMAHHPGDVFDYEDGKPDGLPADQHIPPMIMVATTAGTGSEVGRSSVISDEKTKVKKIIFTPRMMPNYAILDPTLTLNLPASITAATGLDALSHLVEAYLAKGHHPMSDGIALKGISMVANSLRDCYDFARLQLGDETAKAAAKARLGDDLSEARHLRVRGEMLEASMMGATAFQKGLGVTHSCAHSLSAVVDMHHGLANGILMPHAMRFNAKAVPDRFVSMAQAAGLTPANHEEFINWLVLLQHELGVPTHLGQAGVTMEHLEDLVKYALQDGCHLSNPCPVSESDFRQIFTEAIGA